MLNGSDCPAVQMAGWGLLATDPFRVTVWMTKFFDRLYLTMETVDPLWFWFLNCKNSGHRIVKISLRRIAYKFVYTVQQRKNIEKRLPVFILQRFYFTPTHWFCLNVISVACDMKWVRVCMVSVAYVTIDATVIHS